MWQSCLNTGKCESDCSELIRCWSFHILSALITIGIRATEEERWTYGKTISKKKKKKVQPSGAGRATTYALRKPESVIMNSADTFSLSSLSRRLGARTFYGEWIVFKRSLVGFHINNDTNRKRLKFSRLENQIKSSYPAWPPHSERRFPVVRSFQSHTSVVYTQNNHGQTKNDGRRSNINERNFTLGLKGRERISIIVLQKTLLTTHSSVANFCSTFGSSVLHNRHLFRSTTAANITAPSTQSLCSLFTWGLDNIRQNMSSFKTIRANTADLWKWVLANFRFNKKNGGKKAAERRVCKAFGEIRPRTMDLKW